MTMRTSEARADAVVALGVALLEEERLGDAYDAAVGTQGELGARAELQGGSDEVAARQAWLKSVDDDGLGGRLWVNGRQVGGAGSVFEGPGAPHEGA